MSIRDILLQLNSYPEPTPAWAIESAAYMAKRLDAIVSAGLCQVVIPDVSNWLSQLLVRSRDAIDAENHKSAHNGTQLLLQFDSAVDIDYRGEAFVVECPALVTPWQLAVHARLHDLTIVPFYGHDQSQAVAEGLVFESGRPVLLLPPEGAAGHRFDSIVIGWDGSRTAARAVADSLVICKRAQRVTVAAVMGDKDLTRGASAADLIGHLSRHGIAAELAEVPAAKPDAGMALLSHCTQSGADLLVMGAYGHARAREFVLGGATRSVLHHTDIPVLLSN